MGNWINSSENTNKPCGNPPASNNAKPTPNPATFPSAPTSFGNYPPSNNFWQNPQLVSIHSAQSSNPYFTQWPGISNQGTYGAFRSAPPTPLSPPVSKNSNPPRIFACYSDTPNSESCTLISGGDDQLPDTRHMGVVPPVYTEQKDLRNLVLC